MSDFSIATEFNLYDEKTLTLGLFHGPMSKYTTSIKYTVNLLMKWILLPKFKIIHVSVPESRVCNDLFTHRVYQVNVFLSCMCLQIQASIEPTVFT